MAQKVQTTYVDDLDGTEIAEGKGGEVHFGFEGANFVIDLTDKNKLELEKVLTPYLNAARPDRGRGRIGKKAAATSGPPAADIRAWAKDNGFGVPERGRIPAEIREAYKAAH